MLETVSAPENYAGTVGYSDMLRYTESDVYLVDGRVNGVADDMVGKHGLAWYRPSESRWYFREYGTDDNRIVHFHQLGFCPMVGDEVLSSSGSVPLDYRMDMYGNMEDSQIQNRLIKVTKTEWSDINNLGQQDTSPRIWVTGEVKSVQKPDDTEEVRFPVYSPYVLHWMFPQASSLYRDSHSVPCRNLAFHEFHQFANRMALLGMDKTNYQSDIELIGDMLREEAESRSWCEEYDSFIDHFNSKSKAAYIEPRSNDYQVDVEMEYTIRVKGTVYTSARNEDEAVDNVRDMSAGDMDIDFAYLLCDSSNYEVIDEDVHEVGDANVQ